MQLEENKIYEVFKKIEIRIQGQTISKEKLLKSFGQYLTQTFSKRDHNIGLIMHTGSFCFDAMLVTYAMIFNLISNKVETGDVVNSFSEGDIVLYGQNKKSRYFFGGFVDGSEIRAESGKKYIKLTQGGTSVNYIPEKSWRNIEPYNGDSVRMDGRGIRKKSSLRDDFFVEVLGFTKENIPSVLDTSCVIVAPRDRVDYLVKNISLAFGKKKISLLELVTASYFTEEDEYRYGGNTGKNEPTLKFTAKVSAARQLLLSRRGNRHLGLIVLGEDSISRGYSELHELINRKSLQYVYISSSIDSELAFELTLDIEETEVFACTKDFLLENSTTDIAEINDYTLKLSKQVNTIIEKDNKLIVLEENGLEKEIVYEFKKHIIAIKRNEYTTDEKERFILLAYSLMKLFVTAPFPMDRFSVAREKGIIDVNTPNEKIKEMEILLSEFPKVLQEKAEITIHLLEKILEQEEKITGKYEWLRRYLYSHVGEKTAIVVPKAYYITMLKGSGMFSDYFFRKKYFTTPNRFDNSQMYECVIVLGDYEGKAFNTFTCNAASTIISVLYESEKAGYYFKNKSSHNRINQLQKKSTLIVTMQEQGEAITSEEKETEDFEKEMEEYIFNADITSVNSEYRSNTGCEGMVNTAIAVVAAFDDDTKAYLSKHYKAYVLDETIGVVKEVEVQEICEGDSIVFTKNNDDTKDIVTSILTKLFQDGWLDDSSKKNYIKANLWKNSLVDFMHAQRFTARKVAELLLKDGATVHEQTILNWLDEDSHTVGPRNVDSIRHIGNITGVDELKDNPEEIFEACREIRSIRRKILDQVGTAVVNKLSGRITKEGSGMNFIFQKIDTLAEIKRVERIAQVEMVVPAGMANRPISI